MEMIDGIIGTIMIISFVIGLVCFLEKLYWIHVKHQCDKDPYNAFFITANNAKQARFLDHYKEIFRAQKQREEMERARTMHAQQEYMERMRAHNQTKQEGGSNERQL